MKETNEYAVVNRYRETIPVDIRGLCDELGVQVHSAFLDPDISGMLESKGNGRYKITVNASDRATRQRFTIAHELGHYISCLSMKLSKAAETQRMSHRGFQSLCHIRVRTVQLPPTSL